MRAQFRLQKQAKMAKIHAMGLGAGDQKYKLARHPQLEASPAS